MIHFRPFVYGETWKYGDQLYISQNYNSLFLENTRFGPNKPTNSLFFKASSLERSSNLLQSERKLSEISLWNQSANLNLSNSIFRDPRHVNVIRDRHCKSKIQLYHAFILASFQNLLIIIFSPPSACLFLQPYKKSLLTLSIDGSLPICYLVQSRKFALLRVSVYFIFTCAFKNFSQGQSRRKKHTI